MGAQRVFSLTEQNNREHSPSVDHVWMETIVVFYIYLKIHCEKTNVGRGVGGCGSLFRPGKMQCELILSHVGYTISFSKGWTWHHKTQLIGIWKIIYRFYSNPIIKLAFPLTCIYIYRYANLSNMLGETTPQYATIADSPGSSLVGSWYKPKPA